MEAKLRLWRTQKGQKGKEVRHSYAGTHSLENGMEAMSIEKENIHIHRGLSMGNHIQNPIETTTSQPNVMQDDDVMQHGNDENIKEELHAFQEMMISEFKECRHEWKKCIMEKETTQPLVETVPVEMIREVYINQVYLFLYRD